MYSGKPYTDIYLVRHGIPNYENDCLTPEGKIEAEETSKFLCKIPFDVIYASSQGRAVQTAQPTAEKLGLPINQLDWAREDKAASYMSVIRDNRFNWGFFLDDYNKKFVEHQNDPDWVDDPFFKDTKFKEGMKFYEEKVNEWLLSLNLKRKEDGTFEAIGKAPKTVALFAHGGMASETIPTILGINYGLYVAHFAHLDTCAYTVIRIVHGGFASIIKHNVKPIIEMQQFKEMK